MSTSALTWLVVLIPAVVGVQLGLVFLRNRIRRAVHRPPADEAIATPTSVDLEQVIEEELHAAFGDHFLARHDGLNRDQLGQRATQLATAAADAAAARLDLEMHERDDLARELPAAVLDALGLGAVAYKP